jgi:tetratricopeptide (TPR) repeat protein
MSAIARSARSGSPGTGRALVPAVATHDLLLAGLLVAALAAASGLAALESRVCRRDRAAEELMYYPKGPMIEKASLGHTALAADLAWLRAVQYYGEHKRSDREFGMMNHIVTILTDLDPHFVNAYIFGGMVTAQEGRDVPAAIALMEKGLKHNPDDWQMNFETGFLYYTQARDYERAAELFRRSAELPGASEATIRFAAYVSKRAGDPRASLFLWQEFYNRSTNEELRARALESIHRLEAEMGRPLSQPRPAGTAPGTAGAAN